MLWHRVWRYGVLVQSVITNNKLYDACIKTEETVILLYGISWTEYRSTLVTTIDYKQNNITLDYVTLNTFISWPTELSYSNSTTVCVVSLSGLSVRSVLNDRSCDYYWIWIGNKGFRFRICHQKYSFTILSSFCFYIWPHSGWQTSYNSDTVLMLVPVQLLYCVCVHVY